MWCVLLRGSRAQHLDCVQVPKSSYYKRKQKRAREDQGRQRGRGAATVSDISDDDSPPPARATIRSDSFVLVCLVKAFLRRSLSSRRGKRARNGRGAGAISNSAANHNDEDSSNSAAPPPVQAPLISLNSQPPSASSGRSTRGAVKREAATAALAASAASVAQTSVPTVQIDSSSADHTPASRMVRSFFCYPQIKLTCLPR